jgi:hypothetical protein
VSIGIAVTTTSPESLRTEKNESTATLANMGETSAGPVALEQLTTAPASMKRRNVAAVPTPNRACTIVGVAPLCAGR